MTLRVTTDRQEIATALRRAVALDPVRNTILGTIGRTLEDTAWAALHPSGALAGRSSAGYPVAVTGKWTDFDELAAALAEVPSVRGLSGTVADIEALLAAMGREPVSRIGQGLFRLDELVAPTGITGSAAHADERHRVTVRSWFTEFVAEALDFAQDPAALADRAMDDGGVLLWRDAAGLPVSMAARRPVIAGSARIGPVYTPAELRGHGYGSAVTAAASREILDEGGIPVLFTDLANPTSNKIYQRMGYRLVENRTVVTLGAEA